MSPAASSKCSSLEAELLKKLDPKGQPERGGLILAGDRLLELTNVSEQPIEGFLPDLTPEALAALDESIGTWHTHPGETSNLSAEDWNTFVQWPDHLHAIVGTDGVRFYRVDRGAVVNA